MILLIFCKIGKMAPNISSVELKDDVDELASFMKANEMDGAKSVHFVFANSPPEGHQTSNRVAINVSGFSKGFDGFQMACASSQ